MSSEVKMRQDSSAPHTPLLTGEGHLAPGPGGQQGGRASLGLSSECRRRPPVTAVRIPRNEGVLGGSIQGVSNLRSPKRCLFSSRAVFLPRGHDWTSRASPAQGGCPAWGRSQLLLPQKKSSGSSLRSPSRSSAGGGGAGRLRDNIRAACDSSLQLLPLLTAAAHTYWAPALCRAQGRHTRYTGHLACASQHPFTGPLVAVAVITPLHREERGFKGSDHSLGGAHLGSI